MGEMSETYTAVYARDGEEWVAQIAEQPGLETRGSNVGELRTQIREALAAHLATEPGELKVQDQFSLPGQLTAVQQEVRATRTDEDKRQMVASMTASRTAKEWAEDLDLAQRAPAAIKWLGSLEGELDVDEMCFAITIAEQVGLHEGENLEDEESSEETHSPEQPAKQV
jgi:predicted RNase H-like HicB family nuclease